MRMTDIRMTIILQSGKLFLLSFYRLGLMITLSFAKLSQILNNPFSSLTGDFTGVSTDTRTLKPGSLYVALKGEQFDGHDFISHARQQGAAGALVSRFSEDLLPQMKVDDTLQALGTLSAYWRNQFSLPLIAVTGSNGKTTLKNMLASILTVACDFKEEEVLATALNLNNAIGLPLTLCRLSEKHRYGVLEMGMNHFEEIAYLTHLAKPTVAIITNAAESHLEALKNVAGVAKAKGEIFQGLAKDGTAVLNADDAFFDYWCQLTYHKKQLTFGLENAADITAEIIEKQNILLKTPNGDISVNLSLLGKHNIRNALAATAGALALHIDLATIKIGLEKMIPTPGRMRPYYLENNVCVIDDTYNANPFSLKAAVQTLTEISGTKIIVLGDMKELGEEEKAHHFDAGKMMRDAGIDYLFTLGNLSRLTTDAFGKNAAHFTDRDHLLKALNPFIKNDVTILIKGSRSMVMEKILSEIIPHHQLEPSH